MSLSPAATRAALAQESDIVWVLLMTIDHPDLDEPIRVCDDLVPADEEGYRTVTSRGTIYACYPFEVDLPADDGDSVSRITVSIDNVDREIIQRLRAISTPPTVTLEVTRAGDLDAIEAGPFVLTLVSARYDALVIQGELAFEDILNDPFPAGNYVPADYPGIF